MLKKVDKTKNPGLAKLPPKVRNKMGYLKKGGRVKKGKKKQSQRRWLMSVKCVVVLNCEMFFNYLICSLNEYTIDTNQSIFTKWQRHLPICFLQFLHCRFILCSRAETVKQFVAIRYYYIDRRISFLLVPVVQAHNKNTCKNYI